MIWDTEKSQLSIEKSQLMLGKFQLYDLYSLRIVKSFRIDMLCGQGEMKIAKSEKPL